MAMIGQPAPPVDHWTPTPHVSLVGQWNAAVSRELFRIRLRLWISQISRGRQQEVRIMPNKSEPAKSRYVLAKPPKPIKDMTEEEIRTWAEQLAQGLKLKSS